MSIRDIREIKHRVYVKRQTRNGGLLLVIKAVKLPLHDSSVNEVSVPKNLSEEAKLLLNSTVKVDFDQAAFGSLFI